MDRDWRILKELRHCSAEALSEQLHAVVEQSWSLPSPAGRGETERIQLERRWSQHLRHAPSGRSSARDDGAREAQERLRDELEDRVQVEQLPRRTVRDRMLPLVMRSWLPISGMHMMDELKGNPETARTYPLLLRAFEREADLITVSRLPHIAAFQDFFLRQCRGWTMHRAMEMTVGDVIDKEMPETLQPLARSLFKGAQEAWNMVAPKAKLNYQCRREIRLTSMPSDPYEVPAAAWLRAECEECPRSLEALLLVRHLVDLHNELVGLSVEALNLNQDDLANCCLADALPPYFFSYEPGSLDQWAIEAAQSNVVERQLRFDWVSAASRVHALFSGVRRILPDQISLMTFLGQTPLQRPRSQQKLTEAVKQQLQRSVNTGLLQEACLTVLRDMEAWLRLAPAAGQTAAEFARQVMHISVDEIPDALNILQTSHVSDAIDCIEDTLRSPLEGLSDKYRAPLSEAAKSCLRALTASVRAAMLQEWRQFFRTYLTDFKEPYQAETPLSEFWAHAVEDHPWVAALETLDPKLMMSSFGPAFQELYSELQV
ncbi:unnamed protein product [Symbiodinium sp. KB8]|nr:unnamed protein product [Symbiodinium sp. KB8]